jgi:hypothetical protein
LFLDVIIDGVPFPSPHNISLGHVPSAITAAWTRFRTRGRDPSRWSVSWQLNSFGSFLGEEVNGVWDVTGNAFIGLGKSVLNGDAERDFATTLKWAVTSPSKISDALREGGHEIAQTAVDAASGDPRAFGQVVGTAATAAYAVRNVRFRLYQNAGGGGLTFRNAPTLGSRISFEVHRIPEAGYGFRPHVDIMIKKLGISSGEGSNIFKPISHWPW